jgi:ATP-dependent Lon protease
MNLTHYNKNANLKQIVKLQLFFKVKLKLLRNIKSEIYKLSHLTQSINKNINRLNQNNLISNSVYITYITKLDKIRKSFEDEVSKPINLRNYNGLYSYAFFIKIAKLKLELLNVINRCGINNIQDAITLIVNKNIETIKWESHDVKQKCKFFNECFRIISIEIYSSKTEQLNDASLISNKSLTEPLCVELDYYYNLFEKIYGAKLYIPVEDKMLVIKGYFKKEYLKYSILTYDFIRNKFNNVQSHLDKISNISNTFKKNYTQIVELKQIILFSEMELVKIIQKYYKLLEKYKQKTISNIIKEFLCVSFEEKVRILSLFLIDEKTQNTTYIAYILYDIFAYKIDNNPSTQVSKAGSDINGNGDSNNTNIDIDINKTKLYEYLHWKLKIKLKDIFEEMSQIQKNISDFTEENIPYDKRIQLMNTVDCVKAKALDKLKEINSSKGESNAKAQQYLDGLLKIPFGIYKRESIMKSLDIFVDKVRGKLIGLVKYINSSEMKKHIKHTGQLSKITSSCNKIIQMNNITSKDIETSTKYIINELDEYMKTAKSSKMNYNKKDLNKYKKDALIHIINTKTAIKLKGKETKSDLSKLILNYQKNENKMNTDEIEYTEEYKIIIKLLENFKEIELDINSYKDKCSAYLKSVDTALDKSVYGMKDAKLQIKRIIAQWINGTNQGYVFGFEGPPGTGKTTLAKLGISRCIKDNEGNSRPFSFIALGGSSNGSTLEGHNYTYVGSNWGKIVDTLITSKCMNPIIYIDELDKISQTEHGKELIGILTHMTDLSQNDQFTDKYFSGVPIDISKCLIIFSYNDVSKVDKILLDRIHRIQINAMNKHEKVRVMIDYVYPQILKSIGFKNNDILLEEKELLDIIDTYTCEPGIRKLKEKVFELFREVNLRYLLGSIKGFPYTISKSFIEQIFAEKMKVHYNTISKEPAVGIVNGLFATESGLGGILFIECYKTISDRRLDLNLTGLQGKTMKESMEVAKTVAWNLLTEEQQDEINSKSPFGLHIHCPEGGTPKDGPSAGGAITLTIYSQLLNKKINNTYALTGEIRLMDGTISKIGGLDRKIDGARRAGVKTVLCPKENEQELNKIISDPNWQNDDGFEVKMVENIKEVIDLMIL